MQYPTLRSALLLLSTIYALQFVGVVDAYSKYLTQAGTISAGIAQLAAHIELNHPGKTIAKEINCICGALTGNGLFKASNIKIITKDFQFSGVIECDGVCEIITAQPFDHSIFSFKGTGKIIYTVDEAAVAEALQ